MMLAFSCKPRVTSNEDVIKLNDTTVITKDSCHSIIWRGEVELGMARDTISILSDSIIVLHDRLRLLRATNSELKEDLGVADYKLLRIREYNRIAGQRNNIKYLRGWINRVLND